MHLIALVLSVLAAPVVAFIAFKWTGSNDASTAIMIGYMLTGWPLVWALIVRDMNRT